MVTAMSFLIGRNLLRSFAGGRSSFLLLHNCNSSTKSLLAVQKLNPKILVQATSIKTCAPLAYVKTEIQKWGWTYLNNQKDMHRPLSPHLTVYRPQLTWMVSGLFRITGMVMGTVVFAAATTLVVAPFDFPQVVEFIRNLGLPVVITTAFKFVISWPIIFHYLNGLRFIGFDLAKGTDIASVYRSGYAVILLSFLLAAVVVFWPKSVAQ